jgi:hypothetical protein
MCLQCHESLWCAEVQEDGRRLCPQFRHTIHHYQVSIVSKKLWAHHGCIILI